MDFLKKTQDVLILGTSNFGSSIILGIFWLYLASLLEKTQYGELGFLMSVAQMGFAIAFLGLGATIVVYEPKNQNIFPAAFVLAIISSSISAVIVYILTQNILSSILILGMTIFFIVQSGLNSKKRYRDFSKHVLIRAAIIVILSLLLLQFFGINGVLLGYFLASLFVIKELFSLMKNKKISLSILKPKAGFMAQMWTIRLSGVFFWWGDKLVIGALFGFSFLANYVFAAQYLLLLHAIPKSIGQYLLPQESEGLKNKKIKIFSILISVIVAVVSIFAIPFGVTNILPQYEESIFPIQIMSIAIIPLFISAIQQAEFLGKENSKIVFVGSVLQSITYLLLIILLGQLYGLIGIAVGFLTAAIIRTIFNLVARFRFKGGYGLNQDVQ